MIDDIEFAQELVRRLNKMCEHDGAKSVVLALINLKVPVGDRGKLVKHTNCAISNGDIMGPLGLMNGLADSTEKGRDDALICAGFRGEVHADEFMGFYLVSECTRALHIERNELVNDRR